MSRVLHWSVGAAALIVWCLVCAQLARATTPAVPTKAKETTKAVEYCGGLLGYEHSSPGTGAATEVNQAVEFDIGVVAPCWESVNKEYAGWPEDQLQAIDTARERIETGNTDLTSVKSEVAAVKTEVAAANSKLAEVVSALKGTLKTEGSGGGSASAVEVTKFGTSAGAQLDGNTEALEVVIEAALGIALGWGIVQVLRSEVFGR